MKPINDGYYSVIDTALATRNYKVDNAAVLAKKPYAVTLLGEKSMAMVMQTIGAKSKVFTLEGNNNEIPHSVSLQQNYPNPFNPSTAISFQLSAISKVTLKIYNVLGQEVATLLNNETMSEGEHEVTFDANGLTSGVYFYRIAIAQEGILRYSETKKLLLMK
ncbi:MAG: T9SS type A sorting domain-containing protein [Ignavibacteriales bacterium]|nr:T9SS type A sorting domain-containing protein [Ignavibacteriales bacterium]